MNVTINLPQDDIEQILINPSWENEKCKRLFHSHECNGVNYSLMHKAFVLWDSIKIFIAEKGSAAIEVNIEDKKIFDSYSKEAANFLLTNNLIKAV